MIAVDYSKWVQLGYKILTFIVTIGGITYLIELMRKRARIEINSFDEGLINFSSQSVTPIRFEAENLADSPNSLRSVIQLSGFDPVRRTWCKFEYTINSGNHSLAPRNPTSFDALAQYDERLILLLFKTYIVRPTKGRPKRVRVSFSRSRRISLVRFAVAFVRYRLFGWIPQE